MILVKKIEGLDKKILIMVDKDLYNKKFEEGDIILEINDFFYGDERESISLEEIMENDIIYVIGEKSLSIVSSYGIASLEDAKYVKGVPYLFIVLR